MLKDRMVALAGIFGKRYSKKQKIRFLRYVQRSAQEKGVKMYLDEGEASEKSGCNVYLGPTQRAKTILAVPYDTPSRLWWPGLHYYPMDPGRNARQESLVMALNFALAAVLLAAYWFAVFRRCFSVGGLTGGLALFGLLLMALLAVNLVLGSANAKNYSRNSASLALALEIFDGLQDGSVAVALLDNACAGLGGYARLADYLGGRARQANVVIFDCVMSGSELHGHCTRERIEALAARNGDIQWHEAASEGNAVLSLFPRGMVITGGSRIGDATVVKGTRSGRDDELNMERMERVLVTLRQMIIALR
mgnify:FL=1